MTMWVGGLWTEPVGWPPPCLPGPGHHQEGPVGVGQEGPEPLQEL